MSSNLKTQSFHDAALESKVANLENARDSMNALYRRVWVPRAQARLQVSRQHLGERVDSGQVHHYLGGSVHSPFCEETSGLKANIVASRRTWSDSVDALHHELVGGSTTGFPRGTGARRFEKSSRIIQDVVQRSTPLDGVVQHLVANMVT